ncbi:MAG: 23S rRNA (uracil(1939)-C(5))-methyltransferase RlmD [Saprospiraceae bacterium]|nr:23S rRNA (uracil(1939)-C(5))-methyltransferase RlmD [Bacteroidia bacterium]NNF22268.1 23S rRNA (uracil(1939)-C(5))-methyltransferase RlmD [Saprospiraceae bacterium]
MARKKKIKQDVKIHGIADKGMGVGRDEDGVVYFVQGPVPGDVVDVIVTRKKSSYRKGIVKEYKSYSSERTEPFCDHFDLCGGCKWQHLEYLSQLKYKHIIVQDAFKRIAGIETADIRQIRGCTNLTEYRNKLEYSFSSRRWVPQEEIDTGEKIEFGPAAGFHRAGAFDKIVQIRKCHLQDDLSNRIRNRIDELGRTHNWSYYNAREHHGFLRNVVLRNTELGEWMIIVLVGENDSEKIQFLLDTLKSEFQELSSIYYSINTKFNDSMYDLKMELYHGSDFITEQLGHIKYKIGPKSFFQTNTKQANVLYDYVVELAELKGHELVYDLYTGLGSIALYIASKCKQVVGIEEIPEAIEDARANAEFNNIDNTVFLTGDVKDLFTGSFIEKYGKADLVIVDPPRAGLHKDVCEMLNSADVDRIIYVSCNPSTQARDIAILNENYELISLQPVDMFPHTHHIENIALLKRREQ